MENSQENIHVDTGAERVKNAKLMINSYFLHMALIHLGSNQVSRIGKMIIKMYGTSNEDFCIDAKDNQY